MTVLVRSPTAAATSKAAPALFDQLDKALKGGDGKELVAKTKVWCNTQTWPWPQHSSWSMCGVTVCLLAAHGGLNIMLLAWCVLGGMAVTADAVPSMSPRM